MYLKLKSSKHARRENIKRLARKTANRCMPDGTPVDNKQHNLDGEVRQSSLVRTRLKRGHRRRLHVELHETVKTVHYDDGLDADIRGKLMPNLISASSHISS